MSETEDIGRILDQMEEIKDTLEDVLVNVRSHKGPGAESVFLIDKPKEIVIRIGTEVLFTYPDADEGYDQIVSAEVRGHSIKIVERSSERGKGKGRSHIIYGVTLISWV